MKLIGLISILAGMIINPYIISSGGGWTPADTTTVAWWDANDESTITTVEGAVSLWEDKGSTGNYDLSQSTGSRQPAHTTGKITFDGNDYLSDSTGPTVSVPFTIVFTVGYNGANTDEQYIIDSTGRSIIGAADTFSGWGIYNGTWLRSVLIDPVAEGVHSAVYNGASSVVYTNGTQVFSGNSGSGQISGTFVMGSVISVNSVFFNGFVREMVIVNNADSGERQQLEGYMAHKWGLTGLLPGDHPYKSTAP